MKIAQRFSSIPIPAIRAMVERAQQLEKSGIRVAHFEIGRPDFDTPDMIKTATTAALDRGEVHYGPNAGLPDLREEVAGYISGRRGVNWDADQVVITSGSIEALYLSLITVLEPGDEVLIPEPCWTAYPGIVHLLNAVPRLIPLRVDAGFGLDIDLLRRSVTPRTKAVLLNTPHNPTGAILDAPTLEGVADIARDHDLLVVSDEIYDQLCFEGQTAPAIAALPGMQDRTALVGGFSKTFSMTGWRIGYLALPRQLVRPAILAHAHVVTSVNTFIQYGAIAALRSGAAAAAGMLAHYQKRRDEAVRLLRAMPDLVVTPGGGSFYLFPRFLRFPDDQQLAKSLLDEAHVATVPGSAFGPSGAGHLRLSVSCSLETVSEGLQWMHEWLVAHR